MFGLFNGSKKNKSGIEIRFHKEATYYGEHGTINVSNKSQGLVERNVKFCFLGISTPPKLDLGIMNLIWDQAMEQGYVPHHIVDYSGCIKQDEQSDNVVSYPAGNVMQC